MIVAPEESSDEAEMLETTDETMDRSTGRLISTSHAEKEREVYYLLLSGRVSSSGTCSVIDSKSA